MCKVIIKKQRCLRCEHEWYPKPDKEGKVTKPMVCPKCKSPYWNIPKKSKKDETH